MADLKVVERVETSDNELAEMSVDSKVVVLVEKLVCDMVASLAEMMDFSSAVLSDEM
jgi:hypothetical protein